MPKENLISCTSCGGEGWYATPTDPHLDCVRCGGSGRIVDQSGSLGPNGERIPDGFRERKTRPKGWLKKAILDGSVRAPNAPDPDEGKNYSGAMVIGVPITTSNGK